MRISLLTLSFLYCFAVQSQSIEQAMDLLNQNKREEAKKAFTALSEGKSSADALLSLTILEINSSHFDKAFGYFQGFFATHPNPYPYVYALWNSGIFRSGTKKTEGSVVTFMMKLATDPNANATLRAMAADNVAGKLLATNKVDESKAWYAKIGDVKNWATVGCFENVSSSGFGKDFGVLGHPEAAYSFTNNTGAPVKWFNIPDARNDRWWDFNYHYDINNSIIYSQTFFPADADAEVILMLGVSGSFKVWINDVLVASEPEERNTDMDVYQYKVKFQKGNNRILLQLGNSELNNSNYLLRFTDLNGKLLENLKTTQGYSAYKTAQPYEVNSFPFFAEKSFEDKLATSPNFLDKLMLVNVYNHNDKRYEARKLAQQLKKEEPHSSIISEVLVETYSRDNNSTDLNKEIEFIKINDSLSLYALVLLSNDAIGREDYDEAMRILQKRIALYGANADTESKLLDILAKKKDYEKLLKELDYAYKTYPDEAAFVTMQYSVTENVTKDLKKSNEVLINYLKGNYNEDIYEAVIANKMKLGKMEEGLKLFKKMIEDKPYATMRYTRIANKYFESKDYNNALIWQQQAMDRAPYAGGLHYTKAAIYDAAGKKTEALEEYKKAIAFSPSNYDARKKLRELEGKKDLFKSFIDIDAYALYKNAPQPSEYPNDNSIYLLKDLQQVVYPENGASEERNELLIKIFNQAGIDDWKELSIPYNGYTQRLIIDKAEIIKKDGSKVPAETNENQVVFSSLQIGDGIHLLFKLETATAGKLAEHFWEDFNFNSIYPIKVARYSLMVPREKKFQHRMYNSNIEPAITNVDAYKMFVWEKLDAAGIQSEPFMPAFSDIAERVVVTSIPDWNYVANWYSDLSNVKAKTDFEIKEKVKELFDGKQGLNDIQKATLIYDYIEKNFNYSDVPFLHSALTPQRASRTLRTRLGDCKDLSTLFVAMSKEAGLNANLVLVDTRDNGDKNLDLPTIGFNHCIAELKSGGKNHLIELTNNYLPFGAMGYSLINSNGLLIPKDGTSTSNAELIKLNTSSRPANFVNRTTTINFKGNTATIERSNKRYGAEVATTRYNFKHKGEDDRKKDMLSSLSGEFNKKVALKSLTISNLDDLSDTLLMGYNFTVDNYSAELMGIQIFKLPWSDSYNTLDFVSLETRKYPLNLWSFSSTNTDKETMTIMIPAGKKLAEIPKNVSLKLPAISYSLSYSIKPDRLVVIREVQYLKDQVDQNEYEDFKEVITQISEADQRQYGVK